ncbi:hypothetical protein L208DRAFT_1458704 [Tricholoma matsutake]|nr:hypothetical protein L208DRAFT_1458704 [Tricholoma matsutake 945]
MALIHAIANVMLTIIVPSCDVSELRYGSCRAMFQLHSKVPCSNSSNNAKATEAGFRDGASADVEGGGGGEGEGVSHSDGSLGNLKTDSDTSSSTTTKTGMRLVELNGTRGGPIDRSECEDLLRDMAKYVKGSMLALVAPDLSMV